jgi:hypothetical protein
MKKVFVVMCLVVLLSGCALFQKTDSTMSWVDQARQTLNGAAIGEVLLYSAFTVLCADTTIDAKTCTLGAGLDKEWNANLVVALDGLEKYNSNTLTQVEAQKLVTQAMLSFIKISALLKEYNSKGAAIKAKQLRGGDLTLPVGGKKK